MHAVMGIQYVSSRDWSIKEASSFYFLSSTGEKSKYVHPSHHRETDQEVPQRLGKRVGHIYVCKSGVCLSTKQQDLNHVHVRHKLLT